MQRGVDADIAAVTRGEATDGLERLNPPERHRTRGEAPRGDHEPRAGRTGRGGSSRRDPGPRSGRKTLSAVSGTAAVPSASGPSTTAPASRMPSVRPRRRRAAARPRRPRASCVTIVKACGQCGRGFDPDYPLAGCPACAARQPTRTEPITPPKALTSDEARARGFRLVEERPGEWLGVKRLGRRDALRSRGISRGHVLERLAASVRCYREQAGRRRQRVPRREGTRGRARLRTGCPLLMAPRRETRELFAPPKRQSLYRGVAIVWGGRVLQLAQAAAPAGEGLVDGCCGIV